MNTILPCALTADQGVRYVYNVSKKLKSSTLQTAGTIYHSEHIIIALVMKPNAYHTLSFAQDHSYHKEFA